ncbi:MAG: hypothetical protein J2P48_00240 [Alphaproteobacteria bacterium]|nr:hypothetical protein [Alphaproteobacteria bacterium]
MGRYATAGDIVAWMGLCPGQNARTRCWL